MNKLKRLQVCSVSKENGVCYKYRKDKNRIK